MSVRKRSWTAGGVERTAWVVDYVDAKGKRRLKTFAKKKDADAFAPQVAVEVKAGLHVADSESLPVAKVGRMWLDSDDVQGLERSSAQDYERTFRLHILPFLGSHKLSAITSPVLREFSETLRSKGRSAQLVRRVLTTLGTMLGYAQDNGLVIRNAVRESASARRRSGSTAARQEKRRTGRLKVGVDIPSLNEIKALIGVLEGRWRPLILTAIFTGLRASELRGLRWQDIDFEGKEIRIHQRADRFNKIGAPKTLSSERKVPAGPMVLNALRLWRLECPRRNTGKKDVNQQPVMELNLVFPNGQGRVEVLGNILKRGLHPAWLAAGITVGTGEIDEEGREIIAPKYTGMHCLRHFYASWCINPLQAGGQGLTPKEVQDRLGHSTIVLTLDRYGHLFPRDDDGASLAKAEAALFAT